MYRLSEADLKAIPASLIWEEAPETVRNGWEAIGRLRDIYTQSIGFEFAHIHAEDERLWLLRQVESGMAAKPLQTAERTALLNRLMQQNSLEPDQFQHGQKHADQRAFGMRIVQQTAQADWLIFHDEPPLHVIDHLCNRDRLLIHIEDRPLAHLSGHPALPSLRSRPRGVRHR